MTDTITRQSSPEVDVAGLLAVVHAYQSSYGIRTILHDRLNDGGYNITYRQRKLRRGTLRLLFATAAEAHAAAWLLTSPYLFRLVADEPSASMGFVVAVPGGTGDIDLTPYEGVEAWTLNVPFQEIDL